MNRPLVEVKARAGSCSLAVMNSGSGAGVSGEVAHEERAAVRGPCIGPREVVYERSRADIFMRRVLRLPVDAPPTSVFGTEDAFGKSIAISAIRCTFTYILLPLLAPVVSLTGTVVAPLIGITLGLVSMVSIVFSMRRFFASDHKWRWGYSIIGVSILVMLLIMMGIDISHIVS